MAFRTSGRLAWVVEVGGWLGSFFTVASSIFIFSPGDAGAFSDTWAALLVNAVEICWWRGQISASCTVPRMCQTALELFSRKLDFFLFGASGRKKIIGTNGR